MNLSDSGGLDWALQQALDLIYYRLIALHMMPLSPIVRHSISDCENVENMKAWPRLDPTSTYFCSVGWNILQGWTLYHPMTQTGGESTSWLYLPFNQFYSLDVLSSGLVLRTNVEWRVYTIEKQQIQ